MHYLNLFFINSFLGFLLETGLKTFVFSHMNNGILFGPWIPIYGFGAVIITFLGKLIFQKFKISKLWKSVILFFAIFLVLSFLEWIGGMVIESFFHLEFWSYRNQKYNFGPYISLGMSLIWGFLSLLFFYVILPLEEKFIKKIPRWFTFLALIFFFVDLFLTCWLI